MSFFFFQAEDGIRDLTVTGVQTCALPICDQIIALDGRPTEGWKNDQAVKELRGEPGTAVELKVRRVGVEQPLTFKLSRATIHIRSVQVAMLLDDRVGYVALNPVSEASAPELADALKSLTEKGMKSLILDLRGNPGGLLEQGVAVGEDRESTSLNSRHSQNPYSGLLLKTKRM